MREERERERDFRGEQRREVQKREERIDYAHESS